MYRVIAGLAPAARPGQVACFPNFYVYMHVYRDVVRLPQASRPRQAAIFPFPPYACIHMHREMMGLPRQPAPGQLLAFPIEMYTIMYTMTWGRLPQAGRSKQADWGFHVLCMYAHVWRDDGAGLGMPPQADCFPTSCV